MSKNKKESSKKINKSNIEIDREKGDYIHIKEFGWFKKDDIMNKNKENSPENRNKNSLEIDGEKGDYFHMKGLGWLRKEDIYEFLDNPNMDNPKNNRNRTKR